LAINLRNRYGVVILGLFLGAILGWAANFLWYLIHALGLGWGDSAPEWNIRIQNNVQITIFILSCVFCILLIEWRYRKTMKNEEKLRES
jgi:SNF family Na+-dependent transporter